MNEQESQSNDYLRPPLWHGKLAFGKVSLKLTLQKREDSDKSVQRFRQVSLFALDEPFEQKFPVIRRRLLVLGLYLSFLACVTGLWLTANVTSGLDQKLPPGIANFIAAQPVAVLLVPLLILLGCYFLLRLMTYEIIAWPERFLDERQQMVRDHAHRNAYKLVKVVCLLVPLYLCLHAVLWTPPAPAPTFPQPYTMLHSSEYLIEMAPNTAIQLPIIQGGFPQVAGQTIHLQLLKPQAAPGIGNGNRSWFTIAPVRIMISSSYISSGPAPSWPNDPASLLLYYGTLLLSLLLMAIALPMSLVAWKERL
jgi:hypothetical protein